MSIYARILQTEEPTMAVEPLIYAIGEHLRNSSSPSLSQIASFFDLDSTEQAQVDELIDRFTELITPLNREEAMEVCLIAQYGVYYTTETALKSRLGVTT